MIRYWDYLTAAQVNYAEGRFVAAWHNLLEAEFAKDKQQNRWSNRKPNTPRQKEIQRLWQQRGLLERTKANLRIVLHDETLDWQSISDKGFLASAIEILNEQIDANDYKCRTVKERIPA